MQLELEIKNRSLLCLLARSSLDYILRWANKDDDDDNFKLYI
jgi:hypothetical protein